MENYKTTFCPDCKKFRLFQLIQADGTVNPISKHTYTVRDELRYSECCNFCYAKYQKRDLIFFQKNMAALTKERQNNPASSSPATLDIE